MTVKSQLTCPTQPDAAELGNTGRTMAEQEIPIAVTAEPAPSPSKTPGQRMQRLGMLVMAMLMWGLVLAGWGLGDLAGFVANPVRLAFLLSLVPIAVIVFVAMPEVQSCFRKGTETAGNWLIPVFLLVGAGAMFFFPFADRRGWLVIETGPWRYLGLALFITGSAIRLTGAHTLGRQFSGLVTIQDQHRLVQTGIYSVVRHPMYLGLLVEMPGFALVFRSKLAVLYFLVCLLVVSVRVKQEEALLRRHFGQEYETYCQRTPRLIPFIY